MEQGFIRRLSLVLAPPGHGKTTLLTLVGNRLAARGIRIAWLSADEEHRDPAALLADLARAIDPAGQSPAETPSLSGFIAAMEHVSGPVALILDDFDKARCAATEQLVRIIIDKTPAHIHIVIGGCRRANIGAPTLRAQGQVTDISADDLAFDRAEIASFFHDVLPPSAVETLNAQTEGWPIILAMMRSHIDRLGPDAGANLWHVAEDVAEFLDTEVLGHWSEDKRSLITEAALFDAFNDGLMEELAGERPLLRIERLAESELPVKRCGPGSRWLRFNPVLRRHLHDAALQLPAERRRRLHASAARFFAETGDLRAAIRLGRDAEDFDFVAELVEGGVMALSARQGVSPLRELLDGFPTHFAERHRHLRLGRVLVTAKEGRIQEARRLLMNAVEENAVETQGPMLSQDAFEQDCVLIDQLLGYYEDAVVDDDQLSAIEVRSRDLAENPWLSGCVHNVLFMCHFGRGNILSARVAAEVALSRYGESANLYSQIIMRGHLAALDLADLDFFAARQQLETARSQALDHFPADPALMALLDIPYAELLHETGESERSAALIAGALDVVERNEGWVDLFARGYTLALRIALAAGDAEAAQLVVARCERTALQRGLARLQAYSLLHQIELAIFNADFDRAGKRADEYGDAANSDVLAGTSWRERQYARLVMARLAAARADGTRADRHLRMLEDEIAQRGPRWFELSAQLSRAMLLDHEGRLDEAATHMRLALNSGARQSRRRVFLDEGKRLATAMVRIARHAGLASFPPESATFLASIVSAHGEELSDKTGVPRIFSPREMQVLRELSLGKPNKVIARTLNLTEATVKFHLAHIYSKLGVNNRMLAAAVARERRLVD